MSTAALDRGLVERLVREAISKKVGPTNGNGTGRRPPSPSRKR